MDTLDTVSPKKSKLPQKIILLILIVLAIVAVKFFNERKETNKEPLTWDTLNSEPIDSFSLQGTLVSVDASGLLVYKTGRVESSPEGNAFVEKEITSKIAPNAEITLKTNVGGLMRQMTIEEMAKSVPAGAKLFVYGFGNPFGVERTGITKIEVEQ